MWFAAYVLRWIFMYVSYSTSTLKFSFSLVSDMHQFPVAEDCFTCSNFPGSSPPLNLRKGAFPLRDLVQTGDTSQPVPTRHSDRRPDGKANATSTHLHGQKQPSVPLHCLILPRLLESLVMTLGRFIGDVLEPNLVWI